MRASTVMPMKRINFLTTSLMKRLQTLEMTNSGQERTKDYLDSQDRKN
jgi:hypothetical protein